MIVADRWHEAKHHAQQAGAARQTVRHLQTAAAQALAPVLVELAPRHPADHVVRALARDIRAAVPDEADRIIGDPAWPALATVLADAESRGHQPYQLLKDAAAQRELTTARQPARVLITRIQHTSRNPAPNRQAEAARLRSTMTFAPTKRRGESPPTPTIRVAQEPHMRKR